MKFYRKNIHSWSRLNKVNTAVVYPKTNEEIIDIFKDAKKNGKKISIMGHGCSHGDLFFFDNQNIVVNTRNFNNILNFDKSREFIKVQSGASILKVNNFLYSKKFTINCIPSNYEITIGGAVSNNVFGKDSHLKGLFGNNLLEIVYINHKLEIIKVSSQKEMANLVSTIGLLGFILNVTLKIEKLKSNILLKKNYYYKSIDNFLDNYKYDKLLEKDFHTIKVNQFKNNYEVFVETYMFSKSYDKKSKYYDINKFKTFLFFKKEIRVNKFLYKIIKNFTLIVCSLIPMRIFWKVLNLLGFYYFKKNNNKKIQSIHIMNLLHNNNFSDHNILFKRYGFYSFQIMIKLNDSKTLIKKYFDLAKKYKCESYLSTIKFLPKRNDFIYDYDKHIAIEIYTPRTLMNRRQNEFLEKIINLIIENNNQIIISKDNILNKLQFNKIFPKIENFRKLKNKFDPNNFFHSSYFDKIK